MRAASASISTRWSLPLAKSFAVTTLVYINAVTADKPEAGPWQHDPCGATQKIAALAVANLTA